ncbi:MAG: hypothetical protein QOE42_608, partial [Chloroflexota bacterium]|nr:hypothetical protein [Chloroflexota bacterium]
MVRPGPRRPSTGSTRSAADPQIQGHIDAIPTVSADAAPNARVDLLDVGHQAYSDCALIRIADRRILIDGAHPANDHRQGSTQSITEQLQSLLSEDRPAISLLIVSHTHLDHIGALPSLIASKAIDVEWALVSDLELGWGRTDGVDASDALDDVGRAVLATLREEPLPADASDALVDDILADSVDLDITYNGMLRALAAKSRLIRYGRDDAGPLATEFKDVGFSIFGPSQAQLLATAAAIAGKTNDDARRIADARSADAVTTAIELYRAMATASTVDAASERTGKFVNLQSIVTGFGPKTRRFLFTGDMQLADPETKDPTITAEVAALRRRLDEEQFAFVKLPHHGSANGLNAAIAPDLRATDAFGIIGGSDGRGHPAGSVLDLLSSGSTPFIRTDRNGLSSIVWASGKPTIQVARGAISDDQHNDAVESSPPPSLPAVVPTSNVPPAARPSAGARSGLPSPGSEARTSTIGVAPDRQVRVRVDVPHVQTLVRVAIEVLPGIPGYQRSAGTVAAASGNALQTSQGSDYRSSPARLLYVTEPLALERNVGPVDASAVLGELAGRPGSIVRLDGGVTANDAIERTRDALEADPSLSGVVLVGGYDVVPPQAIDVIPVHLRDRVRRSRDADGFVVWSDTNYAYRRDRRQLPISRAPDARLGGFLRTVLAPPAPTDAPARGVRNKARPFAEPVFGLVQSDRQLWVSEDASPAIVGEGLVGDVIYLMLHGSKVDGTRLWGESGPQQYFEAVNLKNIKNLPGSVVLM